MKGRYKKNIWGSSGNDAFGFPARSRGYGQFTGDSTNKRRSLASETNSYGGGGFNFSGIKGIGLGYDSFTGIRPKDRRGNKHLS